MAHLINKDTLENILRGLWKEDDGKNPEHRICYNKALQEVQCEIDSLEVKETEYNNILALFNNLSEEDKVSVVAELYWQLTCAQRDEFLRETENN